MSWNGFYHAVGVITTGLFGLVIGLGILFGGAYLIDEVMRSRNRIDMLTGQIRDLQMLTTNLIKRAKKK